MSRIFKNKTAEEVAVSYGNTTLLIAGNSQADLSEVFEGWQLSASETLIGLLGQGIDKYQLNDGTSDLAATAALRLLLGIAPAEGPKQSDGSPYVSPCMFPSGVYLYITGADDSGAVFKVESETEGDVSQDFSFNDWVLIAGGGMIFQGAVIGDLATMEVFCPATPVTPNAGHTGNCNVVSGIIVPAAGNGEWDVDLAAANPVLTPLHDGYWEWSFPNTGRGTVSAGAPGVAGAHLIAVDYSLIRFVNKALLLGGGALDFTIPAIEPKICLPHWKIRVILHNGGHAGLKAVWHLTTARVKTI